MSEPNASLGLQIAARFCAAAERFLLAASVVSPVRRGSGVLIGVLGCLVWSAPCLADPVPAGGVRLSRDSEGRLLALETPVIHLRREQPPSARVDLYGAVHIAENEYYDTLNERFESYDAVLYELVAEPHQVELVRDSARADGLSSIQQTIARFLGLEFQLEGVDYRRGNFVHADLSFEELARKMDARGEGWLDSLLKLWLVGLSERGTEPEGELVSFLLTMLFEQDPAVVRGMLRRKLALEFERLLPGLERFLTSEQLGLIDLRNDRAVSVLEREIAGGKSRVAVFYGAAHLSDLEKKIVERHGFRRESVEWLPAWDLSGTRNAVP